MDTNKTATREEACERAGEYVRQQAHERYGHDGDSHRCITTLAVALSSPPLADSRAQALAHALTATGVPTTVAQIRDAEHELAELRADARALDQMAEGVDAALAYMPDTPIAPVVPIGRHAKTAH